MQTQQSNIMETLPVKKLLFTMSWPIVVSMVIQGCYNIVDSIFVSGISQDAFIALSLVYPVQMLMIAVNIGIGVGINALLSRRLGQKRYEQANDVAAHGYVLYLGFGLLFALIGLLFARPFMGLFSENSAVIEYGTTYLRIAMLFASGMGLQFAGERMMQATGNPIWNMYIQASGAVINIIFDPLLIFDSLNLGFITIPCAGLGIAGAALATVIAQWCGAFIGIYLVVRKVKQIQISFRHFRLKGEIVAPIFRVGVPAIIVQSLSTLMALGLNKLYSLYSEDHVAVLGAYFKIQYFAFTVLFGLGNAVVPMISFNHGARHRVRVEGIIRTAMVTGLVSMGVSTLILLLFPSALLSLFHLSPTAVEIGVPALRIIASSFVAAGICLVFSYTFQAVGSNSFSLLLALLRQMVILLPLAALLAHFHIALSWWAFPITEWFCCILSVLLYRHAHKMRIAPLEESKNM